MENKYDENTQNEFQNQITPRNHRVWSGLILLAAGFLLLAYKMGAPIPSWIFTWPMILILIGVSIGIKRQFRTPGAFILIALGVIFLIDQNLADYNLRIYIAPLILIAIGLSFILRPRGRRYHAIQAARWQSRFAKTPNSINPESAQNDDAEYLDVRSVLGGVKKNIVSKNFKGGEIVCFMGGAELNLTQADLQHPIVLDVTNVFGGTKLVVPSNWDIKNEVTTILGGIDDKRNLQALNPEKGKTVLLKGTCLFGGIEISDF